MVFNHITVIHYIAKLSRKLGNLNFDPNIAFLIHEPTLLDHIRSLFLELDNSKFCVVYTQYFDFDPDGVPKNGASDFREFTTSANVLQFEITDIISCGKKFKYVITNHPISGDSSQINKDSFTTRVTKILNRIKLMLGISIKTKISPNLSTFLPLQIGKTQIRFMYGMDLSDSWSLSEWNQIYDIFLCHGVFDSEMIKSRFGGEIFVMGYPRYDSYFDIKKTTSTLSEEFHLNRDKKTVVWMPTLGSGFSSVPVFASRLNELGEKVDLILRPHPLSLIIEPEIIDYVKKFKFIKLDLNTTRNLVDLYGISDLVLVDYGGVPFSCTYLGLDFAFLEVPNGDSLPINESSNVLELRKHVKSFNSDSIHDLPNFLSSSLLLDNRRRIQDQFALYFGVNRTGNTIRLARYLEGL